MLGYKRSREGRRNTQETVERKTEESPDGHVTTTETINREIEEEYQETEQQLQIDAEILKLQKIPAIRQLEQEKMKDRQKLAENRHMIRYTFAWIEQDIQRCRITPLPLLSPAQMELKGWPVIESPELIWIPLYWRATRDAAVVDLPDLTWISELETRADGQLWAHCDFLWSDDHRELRGVWVPELLLRTYPPYAEVVEAASHHKIQALAGDFEHATQKRIQMIQNPGLSAPVSETRPTITYTVAPSPPRVPVLADRGTLEKMLDHPESAEELEKLRSELKNVMVPHVQKHLDTLSLTEQLFFLGDASFVVSRYYMTAMEGNQEIKLPRIQVANYIEGTKIRCKVDGLEDPVWLPASLIFAGHAQCRCGPICSCRWRALEVAYDVLLKFICG